MEDIFVAAKQKWQKLVSLDFYAYDYCNVGHMYIDIINSD